MTDLLSIVSTDIRISGGVFRSGSFTFSECGLVNVEGVPPLEETERVLSALLTVGQALMVCAGDLLVWAEQHYGDQWTQVTPLLEAKMNLEHQTLLNAKSVMGKIPPENRIPNCPFKVYEAVRNLPAEQQKVEIDNWKESEESARDLYYRLNPKKEQDYFVSIVCKDCGSVQEFKLDRFAKVKEDHVPQANGG